MGIPDPGSPGIRGDPGRETTTGPLGQGIANAVGMAIAESHLAARFNKTDASIIDHHTFCMCGDGDLMEGVAMEAVSLAGHLGLGKLILIYDDNQITIEGATDIAFTENVADKFSAMNWHVVEVENGNDLDAVEIAIQAGKEEQGRPSLIKIRTHIAYGSPNKQDTADAHGAPLGEEEIRLTKKFYGMPEDQSFCVPEPVTALVEEAVTAGENVENAWQDIFLSYKKAYPREAALFVDAVSGFLTKDWDKDIPDFSVSDAPTATRAASGKVLNAIAPNLPSLMGGSADLAPSNKTYLNGAAEFQKNSRNGRNIRFGVREHAMGGIMSGMYLHSGVRPYGGTFLVFADYMRPAIRLAALMKLPVIYVFTHDSVAVGEDGPPISRWSIWRPCAPFPGFTWFGRRMPMNGPGLETGPDHHQRPHCPGTEPAETAHPGCVKTARGVPVRGLHHSKPGQRRRPDSHCHGLGSPCQPEGRGNPGSGSWHYGICGVYAVLGMV